MVITKQLNINNKTYYFYNDPRLLKIDKKESMDLGIYYTGYVDKKHIGMLIV